MCVARAGQNGIIKKYYRESQVSKMNQSTPDEHVACNSDAGNETRSK